MQRSYNATDATVATTDELRGLMEEVPGGVNYGRTRSADPETFGAYEALNADEAQFFQSGGWRVVDPFKDEDRAGLTAHRGVLHPDEYVDAERLRAAVEDALGFTFKQVHSVFRQGRLSTEQGELRASIDARLLALSRAGANMLALGRVLGLRVRTNRPHGGPDCPVLDAALARARAAEEVAA